MASSGGSSLNSYHTMSNFSTSQYISSFTDLLTVNGKDQQDQDQEQEQERTSYFWETNSEPAVNKNNTTEQLIPKYKSFPPASLPLSPSPLSPSSYLSFPSNLTPSIFLDSPVLFSSSNVLPSPTTGTFSALFSKDEESRIPNFSFPSQTRPSDSSSSIFSSSVRINSTDSFDDSLDKQMVVMKSEAAASLPIQMHYPQPPHFIRDQKKSDDGYNWRKYGQKQVKGSENPRSYYKCTYLNCPTKKKVEQNLDGHITEIVYKGSHNHPKPQSTRRSSSSNNSIHNNSSSYNNGQSNNSFLENAQVDPTAENNNNNSSASFGDDDFEQGSSMSNSRDDDENEPQAKRWKGGDENEGISASGSRTVREPRIVVQTTSDIDILDDGYRWRKYGQKVVKGNPNPRSYYKCTFNGCPVRKHVERAGHDVRAVITTYEGKHNHDVPAARGSGSYSMTRPPIMSTAIKPSVINGHISNGVNFVNQNGGQRMQNQTPYTLQMLQSNNNNHTDSFAFSGYGNSGGGAKEEPKDDSFFDSFLN
ncbi:hypothetical protein ACP275_10G009400 [Erythranthe tilingii]